jgi:hypothetical protein
MQLALWFENTHFAQIRRHYQSLRPAPERNPQSARALRSLLDSKQPSRQRASATTTKLTRIYNTANNSISNCVTGG